MYQSDKKPISTLEDAIDKCDFPEFKKFLSDDISYKMIVRNRENVFNLIFQKSKNLRGWDLTSENCRLYPHTKGGQRDAYQKMLRALMNKPEIMNDLKSDIHQIIIEWAFNCGDHDFKSWAIHYKFEQEILDLIENGKTKEIIQWYIRIVQANDFHILETLTQFPEALDLVTNNRNSILIEAIKSNSIESIDFLLKIPRVLLALVSEGSSFLRRWKEKSTESTAKILTPLVVDKLIGPEIGAEFKIISEENLFARVSNDIIDILSSGSLIMHDTDIEIIQKLVMENIMTSWNQYQKTVEAIDNMMIRCVPQNDQGLFPKDLCKFIGEYADARALLPYHLMKVAFLDKNRKWNLLKEISPHIEEISEKTNKKYEFRTNPSTVEYQKTTTGLVLSAFYAQRG